MGGLMNLAPFVPLMVHAGCQLIDSELEREERMRKRRESSYSSESYTPNESYTPKLSKKIVFSQYFDEVTCVYSFDDDSVGWINRLFIEHEDVHFKIHMLKTVSEEFKQRLENGESFIDVYNSLKDKGEIKETTSYESYNKFSKTPVLDVWDNIKEHYKFKECYKCSVSWEQYV